MGKKSSPAAPATPDYTGAANAQGQANIDASRLGAELLNQNQVTPWGSQTFSKDPNSDQWTSTVNLSPEQQKLYDLQTQGQIGLGQTAQGMLGRVTSQYGQGLDLSGAPNRVNSLGQSNYSNYSGPTDAPVSQLDFSAAGKAPMAGDFAQQGSDVRDALYHQGAAQLDPQYAQRDNALRTRLINSGVQEGSAAYDTAMKNFTQQRDSAYGDLRDRSILASGQEQSRLNSDALASRGQMLDQITTGGQFQNQAAQQGADNLYRNTQGNNAVESQKFNDALTAANFQNSARGSAIDEASFLRNMPLNEYNALQTGAQVTAPNFRATGQTQQPAASPLFAAAQAQNQSALDMYNSQMASRNSAVGGLYGLAGTALNAYGMYNQGAGSGGLLGKVLGGSSNAAATSAPTAANSAADAASAATQFGNIYGGYNAVDGANGLSMFNPSISPDQFAIPQSTTDAINAANPSALSSAGNIASGALGAYGLYNGLENKDPASTFSGASGLASSLGASSSTVAGLGAGGLAFAIAGLGNQALGNNDPYLLGPDAKVSADNTYGNEFARVTAGNNPLSSLYTQDKGLMTGLNGSKYTDSTGKTYNAAAFTRTGSSPKMVYESLVKQGAQMPSYDEFLNQWNSYNGNVYRG